MSFKIKFISFMTKVNPRNRTKKTKSDFLPWYISNIYFGSIETF